MDDNNAFRDALKNFTFDVACGGAIAHLADCGYIPQEIQGMLDFPTSLATVQETYWKHCVKKKIIVEEKSELGKRLEKVSFVTDYDAYGRMSLRRVTECSDKKAPETYPDDFRHICYAPEVHGAFDLFLKEYCLNINGDDNDRNAYVSCDFGLRLKRDAKEYEKFLNPLTGEYRRYMEGIPWKRKIVWHLLNRRMTDILIILYEQSSYHGTIVLLDKQEEISF
jgi:hypothetical protein